MIQVHPPPNFQAPKSKGQVRIGIAVMTRNPIAFETWLEHHRNIGIIHFFIRVEDSPQITKLLSMDRWKDHVTVTYATGSPQYFTQMDRQNRHVNDSIRAARALGLTHLVHIDDDELIYRAAGKEAFHSQLSVMGANSIKMRNIEAVYEKSDCNNPFKSTKTFCTNPKLFSAYGNGKSIGSLDYTDLKAHGPHIFTGKQETIPSYFALVIHYESSCFYKWKQKFSSYANDSPDACKKGKIPFKFYCESLNSVNSPTEIDTWAKWKTMDRHNNLIKLDVLNQNGM